MRALAPWAGKTIVDLGCGTGYWLARYAGAGGPGDRRSSRTRPSGPGRADRGRRTCPAAEVRAGSAEHTGLPDRSADVVHARFAYFFPPGTDAGLTEVLRVLRPGGTLVMVDNDYRWGEFAGLLAAASSRPTREVAADVDEWWRARGATRHEVRSELAVRPPRRPGRGPAHRVSRPRWPATGWPAIRPRPA